jgi:hypothetical protein
MYLPRSYVEKFWIPSIGEDINKLHFREPPPGTGHAECDPDSEYCKVHYDKVNPHQDPIGHLLLDSPEVLVGLVTFSTTFGVEYSRTKNIIEAILKSVLYGSFSYCLTKLIKTYLQSQ